MLCNSGSGVVVETDLGVRRDTQASLGSVGQSSVDLSPIEPVSALFEESASGNSLSSELFFKTLRLNANKTCESNTCLLINLMLFLLDGDLSCFFAEVFIRKIF